MALLKLTHLALLSAVLFFLTPQPTWATNTNHKKFTSLCVRNCITASNCNVSDTRCICKQARGILLHSVISCLFFNCKDDLRNFEDLFLDPVEDICDAARRDIPRHKLKSAEMLASSYIARIPTVTPTKTTVRPTTSQQQVTATPTSATKPQSSTLTEQTSSSSASSSSTSAATDRGVGLSTSTSTSLTVAPTQDTQPNPTADSSAPASQPTDSDDSGSGFDTNPFGTPRSGGAVAQPLLGFLTLPLVVGVLLQS
ncbi:hypothetical protein VTJ83DRAFT_2059 [Remersonia thermophila]|uniref:Extracellular membrane protein CFEM domain-containing protein n=1 Tax=Remersonia thermophila TaxID=72144 RepID=A0ABR4DHS5_9PEZI